MSTAVTLNDVCEFIVDSEHKTAPLQDEGYPYIRTPNIGRGRLDFSNVRRVGEEAYKEWTKRAVPTKGDLILAREAPVGNVAIVPEGEKVCLGQRTVLLRPNMELVDPEYLNYLLIGDELQAKMHSMSSGATVPHLNMKDIRELVLPELPDLDKQKELASTISAYDYLIENNNRRIAILEEMAQSLYREWFVKCRFPGYENTKFIDSSLGKIPEGWVIRTLEDTCKMIVSGGTPKRKEPTYWEPGEISWVKTKELHDGWVFDTEEKISREGLKNSSAKLFPEKTILMAIYAAPTVGRIGILSSEAACNQAAVGLIPDIKYMDEVFLYHKLFELRQYFNSLSQGAAQQNINVGKVKDAPFVLPVRELLQLYSNHASPLLEQIRVLAKRNNNLKVQRDVLLPKLISGNLSKIG